MTADVSVGMTTSSGPVTRPAAARRCCPSATVSVTEVKVFRRGSKKKSSGSGPLLVIVTGTVTGCARGQHRPGAVRQAAALALETLNRTVPVNGSANSLP